MAKTSSSREFKTESTHVSPPAYFLSLSVENIRCFGPKQTLDLSDGNGSYAPWTIILGDNGFGKTTLLQCLAASQSDQTATKPENVFRPLYIKIFFSGKFSDLHRKYPASFSCSVGFRSHHEEKMDEGEVSVKINSDDGFGIGMAEAIVREDSSGLICYGYGASRRLGKATLSSKAESSVTESLFDEDATLINAEEWFLQADYFTFLSSSSKAHDYREQVKKALIQLLPSVEDIRIQFSSKNTPNVRMEVKTPFGWVHVQSLSLGYRTLIAWVVDLANRLFERYPDSPNPLAEPAVVLVDEIDLHLHPKFQRTLMDYLTNLFPKAQFIATAHSPLVVQAASNANIALLRREGDHVVIDNDVEAIANWRVDQILTSDLFGLESARPPQLDPLLQERTRLLSKSKLSKRDKERLAQLEEQMGDLPVGETWEDLKAMDIIRRAAQLLEQGSAK